MIRIIDNGCNKGLVYSLNTAITLSKGKYIARMDADDISVAQRLALQVKYLNRKIRGIARSKNEKNLMNAQSGFKHKLWINHIYLSNFVSNLLHIG